MRLEIMMTYEEGLIKARIILSQDPSTAHPKNLSDDLLALVVQCSHDEEAKEIALPIMLVLHFCCDDSDMMKSDDLTKSLHEKFQRYRQDCEKEFKTRHLNIVHLHHYGRKCVNKSC